MSDLQRGSESMRPVRTVFAGQSRLKSLSQRINRCIPVSCVIIIPQAIRVTLFVHEQECYLGTHVSFVLQFHGR